MEVDPVFYNILPNLEDLIQHSSRSWSRTSGPDLGCGFFRFCEEPTPKGSVFRNGTEIRPLEVGSNITRPLF